MPQKRDWLDYAQLASSVVQNVQLHHTNETLSQLKRHEDLKAAEQQYQESFLRSLFQLEDKLMELEHAEDITPKQRVFILTGTSIGVKNMRSSAEKSLETMDRWRKAMQRLETQIKAAESGFTPEELADIRQAFHWNVSLAQLEMTIRHHERLIKLPQLKAELEAVTQEENAPTKQRLGLLLTACGFFLGGLFVGAIFDSQAIGIGGFVLSLLIGFIWLGQSAFASAPDHEKSNFLRKKIQETETTLQRCASSAGRIKGVYVTTLPEYIKVYHERIEFVNRVMGLNYQAKHALLEVVPASPAPMPVTLASTPTPTKPEEQDDGFLPLMASFAIAAFIVLLLLYTYVF